MKLGKYISELLFENDFVILPEIGEFSTKYIPARFVPELKKVESPSKVIAFNENNKSGGGLLIEYIAKKENISSQEARDFVTNFVVEMQNSLKSGKKVELDSVGKFSLNESGQILFEGDTTVNYLSDSAGMPSVAEPARKSEEEAKTELDKVMEESQAVPPAAAEEKPRSDANVRYVAASKDPQPAKEKPKATPRKASSAPRAGLPPAVKWVAITVVPLLIIIIVLALNFEYIFGDKSVIWKRDSAPAPVAQTETTTTAPETQPADETPAVEARPVAEAFDPTVAPPAPERGRKVYYIIVGSFEEEHSAIILAEELRRKGARTASVFPVNRLGFYRVSYGYYYDLNEAERELNDAKAINPSAWILHR
ncbi:MAG: SPOR domain-containing protein [Bacteroidales bacterium]